MIDKLLELLSEFYDYIKPYWVMQQYKRGVLLRFGVFKAIIEPGFHWKYPFSDFVVEESVVPTTIRLFSQSLMTKDEKNIVTQAIIKYEISDIKRFLLAVNDAIDALSDMTQGIIKNIIMERNWAECKDPELDNIITRKAKVEAEKWGIKIIKVTLSDLGQIYSVRLFNEGFSRT